jgi:hypothetical protein
MCPRCPLCFVLLFVLSAVATPTAAQEAPAVPPAEPPPAEPPPAEPPPAEPAAEPSPAAQEAAPGEPDASDEPPAARREADALAVPPEPVAGRAIVEHEAGELLPPEWRPRSPDKAPPRAVVDRGRRLPGDVVDRPLTLPAGTFVFSLETTSVFIDAEPLTAFAPGFALGVTRDLELGVSAPTRFDEGEDRWTALDPTFRAAYTMLDRERVEVAARARTVVPASSETAPLLELGVPVLWHAHRALRVDSGVAVELSFPEDEDIASTLRLPLGLAVQAARWLYVGALGTAEIGLSGGRDAADVDAELFVGLTVQARGQAYFDLVGRFFLDGLGGGASGNVSDGGGFGAAVRFYPSAF